MIQIEFLPMPPTVNKQFIVANNRMIKSKEARLFDQKVEHYAFFHKKNLTLVREASEALLSHYNGLRVDFEFLFLSDRLFTKHGKIKKLDTTNRLKSIQDHVSKLIGIDDSKFIETFCVKRVGKTECVNITISGAVLSR